MQEIVYNFTLSLITQTIRKTYFSISKWSFLLGKNQSSNLTKVTQITHQNTVYIDETVGSSINREDLWHMITLLKKSEIQILNLFRSIRRIMMKYSIFVALFRSILY